MDNGLMVTFSDKPELNDYDLDLQSMREVITQIRPCAVDARSFPLTIVDDSAKEGAVENVAQRVEDVEVRIEAVEEELKWHRKKLNTLKNIPAPRAVRKGSKSLKKMMIDTVDLEFGCNLCRRPGIVVNTSSVNKWGKLVLASVKSIYPVMTADVPGALEVGLEIGAALRCCICDAKDKPLKEFALLAQNLKRSKEELDESVYVSEEDEKSMYAKLVAAGFYNFYSPTDEGSFVWKCSGQCWPVSPRK